MSTNYLLKGMQLDSKEVAKVVIFDEDFGEWVQRDDVRSFEADLFRRLAIGYHMMKSEWKGGGPLIVTLDDKLREILEQSLKMRRRVMDADLQLIRDTFWMKDLPKSTLVKEVSKMVTSGDYQSAKRWIIENLEGQEWYEEVQPESTGRGRKGMLCRFGPPSPTARPKTKKQKWGSN